MSLAAWILSGLLLALLAPLLAIAALLRAAWGALRERVSENLP